MKVANNDNSCVFYVYVWRDASGVPFYVGKGKNRRAYDLYDRSGEFLEIHGRGGCSVEIVDWFIHESQALAYEVELIERYGRREYGGTLVNKTDGGDGCSGHIKSTEAIERWRASNVGLKRNAEACAAISNGKKKAGHKHTEEAKAKMSAAQKARFEDRAERERMSQIASNISDATRERMSVAQKLRLANPAERLRLSEAATGKHQADDTRAKISATMRGVPKSADTVTAMRLAQRMKPPRASTYKGVYGHSDKWRAIITIDGKRTSLGTFASAEDAAKAYDDAAAAAWGVGGCYINLPQADNNNALRVTIVA